MYFNLESYTQKKKRFDLMCQAGARNDMTEEEAYALAEEAREWVYRQIHKLVGQ